MRVALTQSRGRLEGLEGALEALGIAVVRAPLIETRPRLQPQVRRCGLLLAELPWLLFSSRSAVEAWQALELPLDGPRLGAVGPVTAAALERAGARVELLGEPASTEGLADRFIAHISGPSAGPVGLPQGSLSSLLLSRLQAAGLRALPLVVYETIPLAWSVDTDVDAVVLASPSAARALPGRVAYRSTLITIGPSTSRAVRARGLVPIEAPAPSGEAILGAIDRVRGDR